MAKVKITVISKIDPKVVFKGNVPNMPNSDKPYETCTAFEEGQVFITEDRTRPEGFCGWAWADIQKLVYGMARGGQDVFVTCCTDGYRPVVFKLERVADAAEWRSG